MAGGEDPAALAQAGKERPSRLRERKRPPPARADERPSVSCPRPAASVSCAAPYRHGGQSMSATKPRSFQELILRISAFWAEQGCVLLQPYDVEMGAGTFHPATTLRALGEKPWRAAYVQPSRRPTDGRYGENPNRLGHYYQFQALLKPVPADPQELLLASYR